MSALKAVQSWLSSNRVKASAHSLPRMRAYVPLEQAYVLLEHTGHYHRALVQYLQELDVSVYIMPVQKRPVGMIKTDKRDALNLANHLYNQLEKGVQFADKTHLVRRLLPATEAALQLKGGIRHRYELGQECTQRKNKLIAICDELFPEMTQVLKDPNLAMALAIREKYPTPHAIATASLTALAQLRTRSRPSNAQLIELQQLARETIGTKDVIRQRGLVLEQTQLIRELKLLQEHMQQLDTEIEKLIEQSREGKILQSMGMGPIQAAAVISTIGNILNFRKASERKSVFRLGTAQRSERDHGGSRCPKPCGEPDDEAYDVFDCGQCRPAERQRVGKTLPTTPPKDVPV